MIRPGGFVERRTIDRKSSNKPMPPRSSDIILPTCSKIEVFVHMEVFCLSRDSSSASPNSPKQEGDDRDFLLLFGIVVVFSLH